MYGYQYVFTVIYCILCQNVLDQMGTQIFDVLYSEPKPYIISYQPYLLVITRQHMDLTNLSFFLQKCFKFTL